MKHNFSIRAFIALLVFLSVSIQAFSQEGISKEKAKEIAVHFLQKLQTTYRSNYTLINSDLLKFEKSNSIYAYYSQIEPAGYIYISPYNSSNPIVAYSMQHHLPSREDPAYENFSHLIFSIIEGDYKNSNSITQHPTNRSIDEIKEYGPYIKSLFGQVNCRDDNGSIINVSNLFTPNNYAPGCVAVSLATMLDYYQWPKQGIGSHTDTDQYGSSKGNYYADFFSTFYDWNNILKKYNWQNSSQQERAALGELIYHNAVALDMDFEYNGATSSVNKIPDVLINYFRGSAKHASATSPIFWKAVDSSLVHEVPVIFAIASTNSNIGHSIVCDGLRIENGNSTFYHLNMGWWGSSNGWYRIQDNFSAGGYNIIESGIIQFFPAPQLIDSLNYINDTTLLINWESSPTLRVEAYEIQYKSGASSWITISDTITSDNYQFKLINIEDDISFRVRAKYLDTWPKDGWSNIVNYDFTNSVSFDKAPFLKDLLIYPNPFQDDLTIDLKDIDPHSITLRIYSIRENKWLKNIELSATKTKLNSSSWQSGYYIFVFESNNNETINLIYKTNSH